MSKPLNEIFTPKRKVRPRIYAYSIKDNDHAGLLKVGQTTGNVKRRIEQQTKTAAIKFKIEVDETAERDDGTFFSDHQVRTYLKDKGFDNPILEWMRCSVDDVLKVLAELR